MNEPGVQITLTSIDVQNDQVLTTAWILEDADYTTTQGILRDVFGQADVNALIAVNEDTVSIIESIMNNPETKVSVNGSQDH
jgi:hypothetical protein